MGCGKKPRREEASPYERKLAQIADQDHAYKKRVFNPQENRAMDDAHEAGSDQERTRLRGKAHLATVSGMRFGKGDPNTPAAVRSNGGGGIQMGKASARAGTNADLIASQDKYDQLTNLAFFGRGQRGIADANLKSVAGYQAGHNALETQSANEASMMKTELLGEAAGMAIGYGAESDWFKKKPKGGNAVGMNTTNFNNGYGDVVGQGNALA